jgi:hypothetical protein
MKRFLPLAPMRRAARAAALLAALAALAPATASALPDGRGWELVSPVEKNGGSVAAARAIAGGGVLQAAADGGSVTYGSAISFGPGAGSSPPASQYLSARGPGGWSTANLTVPILSGSYGPSPNGVPYQLFSPDLSRGLLLGGRHCRSAEAGCPVANPSLPGTDAPAGYVDYYLRQGAGFEALLGAGDVTATALDPTEFDLRFAGATPDLSQVLLESCAALTANATEVPLGASCDPAKQNLYRWSAGGLTLVNSVPGAELATQAGAVSTSGSRVYWVDSGDGGLRLREGASVKRVDEDASEDGAFQAASADGSVAFFTTPAGHLWRYDALADSATDLTPGGGVIGVLGVSNDGTYAYYVAGDGLHVGHSGTVLKAPTNGLVPTDASNFPPTTGSARVSANGAKLAFVSKAALTAFNNTDQKTGLPDSEVFLYDAGTNALRCLSCRANGTRPVGSSSIPGANPNGEGKGAAYSYKPRALSADGNRIFFDSSDVLVGADSNNQPDVYEWQPFSASCAKATGCIDLISSGRAPGGATFVDASFNGDDAFFLTDGSLVGADSGSFDLYDARVGGGFPEPAPPIPCNGDACQNLPSETIDPGLGTLVPGPGNPKSHYFKYPRRGKPRCKGAKCHNGKKKSKGKKSGKGKRR